MIYAIRFRMVADSLKLGVPRTYPRQLRTACGHRVQSKMGYDAARAFLGHTRGGITTRYTGEDFVTAAKVAAKMA